MTKEIKEQIFRQFPEVEYAYKKEVPANRGEVPFWTLFFRFYVADLREDALIGEVNIFAKYKRELELLNSASTELKKPNINLEISLEDHSNVPSESRQEVYEPVVNDDSDIEAEFGGITKTLSRHTGLIAELIQKRSSQKGDIMREIVQKTEHVPERVPQRFEQKNYVNYDEQMRRHETDMEPEGRVEVAAVTEQERSQFFERMIRLNPSVAECLTREENNDYVMEQMQRAEKDGQNSS
ncbi:general transcription factor 2h subunit [Blastocystis sp. subtype 4]|uniref:general transcription factor 2h subunit n=1 Tax=Blastocystis sp. subtype 4 TaxID=944170 RepID=UPI000711BC76|nr:general transcription factor 2h subunit [Blastocystis sp. subtype 4]KNB43310.1 general transcription factor 2h subunit [Blastocystis sp. subtype 4]|eukprot:XP_014526753.1 general transcription factor 2h subunit [Blastocystis sp. subtype 4]